MQSELCSREKFCSSIFKSKRDIPIGPNVAPLVVFTFNSFLITLILSTTFLNTCFEIYGHVAPVLNGAVIGSVLRIMTAKFYNLSFAYSKFEMV